MPKHLHQWWLSLLWTWPPYCRYASFCIYHKHGGVKYASVHLNTPISQMFVWQFVQAEIKGNINALHHCPFVRGIHWWPVFSLTKDLWCWPLFYVMTSHDLLINTSSFQILFLTLYPQSSLNIFLLDAITKLIDCTYPLCCLFNILQFQYMAAHTFFDQHMWCEAPRLQLTFYEQFS